MVFSTKLCLSHVSDGLFSVRNALFCLGAVTWTSMDFLLFSHGMDRLFRENVACLRVACLPRHRLIVTVGHEGPLSTAKARA